MGLTVHYNIKPDEGWSWDEIYHKLKSVHAFASDLPVHAVTSNIVNADSPEEVESFQQNADELHRSLVFKSSRMVRNEYLGVSQFQDPDAFMGFTVFPAPGCEPFEIGMSRYSHHVVEASDLQARWDEDDDRYEYSPIPDWNMIWNSTEMFSNARKWLKRFQKKWNLKKLPKGMKASSIFEVIHRIERWQTISYEGGRDIPILEIGWNNYRNTLVLNYGSYLRAFHDEPFVLEFKGSQTEAWEMINSHQFQVDLDKFARGLDVHNTGEVSWNGFCKTQYASNPNFGGVENFLRAHLSIVEILDYMDSLGFQVEVDDEGDYWDNRDIEALVKEIDEWNAMIAGFVGALNDVAKDQGGECEAPITQFPDFEHLEAKSQDMKGIAMLREVANAALKNMNQETNK